MGFTPWWTRRGGTLTGLGVRRCLDQLGENAIKLLGESSKLGGSQRVLRAVVHAGCHGRTRLDVGKLVLVRREKTKLNTDMERNRK